MRFSRALVHRLPEDRLARVAAVFTFVRRLMEMPEEADRHAHGALARIAGAHEGPALILSSMLLALGERVRIEDARELTFVRVALDAADLRRLPPHALVIYRRGVARCDLALDPRGAGGPFGFLPRPLRRGLGRRRAIQAESF
ncbi:MAG TPA: hypothetical protein VII13_16560 [Vicinamibacteria bacterium]